MIIDTHIHLYDPSRPQGVPWPDPDDAVLYRTVLPAHCKAMAAPEGVTGAVVVEASDWLEDNQWVLDLAEDEPFIVALVGRIDPCTGDFARQVERFAAHSLFRGIRFRGKPYFQDIDRGGFMADMETLAAHDLALDAGFSANQAEGVFGLMRRLPELRVVLDHIAGVPIDGKAPDGRWVEQMHRAAEYPQAYMKVSALMEHSRVQPAPTDVTFYAPTLDALWEAFGEDRLVYGSNWPVSERAGTYAQGIGIVRSYFARKGEEVSEKFFRRNAGALYRPVRGV